MRNRENGGRRGVGASRFLQRRWWDLSRFGLTPAKLLQRARLRGRAGVLAVCVPKAGTHLLERALCLQPGFYRPLVRTVNRGNVHALGGLESLLARLKGGQVLPAHVPWSAEAQAAASRAGVRLLFLIRDPRDILVSDVFYIMRTPGHPQHRLIAGLPSLRERLLARITGNVEYRLEPMDEMLEAYSGWLDSPALTLRFEDLVGPAGGGSGAAQQRVLASLQVHLDPDGKAGWGGLAGLLHSDLSPTFHRGLIGRWREHFDSEVKEAFKKAAGWSLARYGYEAGGDW